MKTGKQENKYWSHQWSTMSCKQPISVETGFNVTVSVPVHFSFQFQALRLLACSFKVNIVSVFILSWNEAT